MLRRMKPADDNAIATPEQRRALRRNLQQRLRDQAEFLVRAVEELEPPKTHFEAEKAAKSLQAVMNVVDKVFARISEDDALDCRYQPTPEEEREHLASWQGVLDERYARFAATRRAKLDAD